MSLPRFSVNNHVFVNMMMLVVLIGGTLFAFTLVREMFPETRPDKLIITVIYPGVQPQEIEKAVAIKIEEEVRDVEGIEKIDSTINEGICMTTLTLYSDVKDVDQVLQEVKNDIDAIEDLPDEIETISIKKFEPKLPVISVALYGSGDEAALKRAGRSLKDELLLLPGISEVEVTGTRDDEISVEIRPEKLLEYDITFREVAEAIAATNVDVSGGELKGQRASIAVRTLGEESRGVDLEDIVVRSYPDGRQVLLAELADIRDDFVETDLESYFNSKPAVNCVVYKTSTQDAIQIADLVKAYVYGKQQKPFDPYGFAAAAEKPWYIRPFSLLAAAIGRAVVKVGGRPDPQAIYEESLKNPFDHNFQTALHTDLARFVEGRLDLMLRNGKTGLLLVLVSLYLFLNWRVAFWSAIGLPVSFLGTFVVMWIFGVSFNLLSMFGLIIVLGIIVDDAIVIGENIYRHVEDGMPPREAAIRGAEEVMWPVTIAVTTTIAAFAPLLFIKGSIGEFMGQLPIVVLSALSVSLMEALLVLPAHLSHLPHHVRHEEPWTNRALSHMYHLWLKLRRKQPAGSSAEAADAKSGDAPATDGSPPRKKRVSLHDLMTGTYEGFLRLALRWRYVTIAVAVSLLIMSLGLFAGGIVEEVFIQKMDSETLICRVEMPVGTPAEILKSRLIQLSDHVMDVPEVVNVQMFVARQYDLGGAGAVGSSNQSHLGQLIVELKAADERELQGERSSEAILVGLRAFSETLSGVNSVVWEAMTGGPGGRDIEILVTGEDFSEIVAVADLLREELEEYDGVFDLDDNTDEGKREVQLRLHDTARPTGVTVGMLGQFVRAAMYGAEARRITRNREDVKIMVRYPERFRTDVYQIETMWIPTVPAGGVRGWVPVREIASIEEAASYNTLHRSQQNRSVTVYGEVNEDIANSQAILEKIDEAFRTQIAPAHPSVRIEFLGSTEERMKTFSGLKVAFPVALLLIYMLLAGLFRSYVQPLVVMSAIPFGIQGAIIGHWVTGNPMTILSWIGLVALTGILVNDSLVLVDFINTRVRSGMSYFEASIEGAKLRLRAILLTTVTTVCGLAPIMFETSFQAKFLIPMAVTLTFGLMFATTLTLIIVPSLNLVYFDFVEVWRAMLRGIGFRSASKHAEPDESPS